MNEAAVTTSRLFLEPIRQEHAQEMFPVLIDPSLYSYIPKEPPTVDQLKKQYQLWEKQESPDGKEIWLNWVGRMRVENCLIGHFQAGIDKSGEAYIAYMVGVKFQRRGFAEEALRAIIDILRRDYKVKIIRATIDSRNIASIELVKKLHMRQVDFKKNADHFKGSASNEVVYQLG